MKNAHETLAIKEEHFQDMRHLVKETLRELGLVDSLILHILMVYDDKKRYVVKEKNEKPEYLNAAGDDVLD